jgi:hypothetical protein
MKRASSIETLIRKSREDFADLKRAYENSLHERVIREDLKVDIKNIFEVRLARQNHYICWFPGAFHFWHRGQ